MEIKTPTPFEAFSGGMVRIYETDADGRPVRPEKRRLAFSERTVGIKRFYAARAAQEEISRLIRVPRQQEIHVRDLAEIGGVLYEIVQVQQISDTNPPVTDLTLRQNGIQPERKAYEASQSGRI